MNVYDNICQLIMDLDKYNFIQCTDLYGKTEFIIEVENNIHSILDKPNTLYIIADYLGITHQAITYNTIEQVVSIGGFNEHNQGKKVAQQSELLLSTVPIPLSNDAFGTNRCNFGNRHETPSSMCNYPIRCIFFINELIRFGFERNFGGIGEFIGLYYSIIDYCIKLNQNINSNLLCFICQLFNDIINSFNAMNRFECLKKLVQALVLKNLIMRATNDHEIGCGIDHFFAREYETIYRYSHGKAVYLGAIISSILFPEWGKWGLNSQMLIRNGILLNIISYEDIDNIHTMNLCLFTKAALNTRKTRNSMLRYLSNKEIIDKQNKFKHGVY